MALQANKDSQITLKGGTIRTRIVKTSETYAMLAEDGGKVFMNTGADGATPGADDVDVYGNLGVLNKNYGAKPAPSGESKLSLVSLGLTTANSSAVY